MCWRRLDVPGREEARIQQAADGWRLTGHVEADEANVRAQLNSLIDCDTHRRTRRVVIGSASGAACAIRVHLMARGHLKLNGDSLPLVGGALDIDLGFTPATNLLPIRRLDLAVGERAEVRTALLRFSRTLGRGPGAIVPARGRPRLPLERAGWRTVPGKARHG